MVGRNADERPEQRGGGRTRRRRTHLRERDRVFLGSDGAHSDVGRPVRALEVGLGVRRRVLLLDVEQVLIVLARQQPALHQPRPVVGRELRRGPIPDVGRDRAGEGIEVARVVAERARVIARAEVGPCRALRDGIVRGALVGLVAHTELEVSPRTAVNRVVAVDLGPGLLVLHIDVLRAEDPTERDRRSAGGGRGVVRRAQVEVGTRSGALQLVSGTAAQSGICLRHVLSRRLAVSPGRTDLAQECQGIVGAPLAVEVHEIGTCALIRPRDLVVDAVKRGADVVSCAVVSGSTHCCRVAGEGGTGQSPVGDHVAGVRALRD